MRAPSKILMFFLLLSLMACKIPADPEKTTQKVQDATLKVGALTELQDPDRRAVERIAQAFNADLQLLHDNPHHLFALLEDGDVQIVAGEIPEDTPFKASVALSDPVGSLTLKGETKKQVLAIRRGENAFLIRVNRALQEVTP